MALSHEETLNVIDEIFSKRKKDKIEKERKQKAHDRKYKIKVLGWLIAMWVGILTCVYLFTI